MVGGEAEVYQNVGDMSKGYAHVFCPILIHEPDPGFLILVLRQNPSCRGGMIQGNASAPGRGRGGSEDAHKSGTAARVGGEA